MRTPAEFAIDHLPQAINAPVLSNEERVIVGTLYKTDAFAATRLGAALAARNIAAHLEGVFAHRPRDWKPLIYCWRGGKRSGSMTAMFNLIGWRARQLAGGYKAYRRWVAEQLLQAPLRYQYRVLCGLTGCGKTRLLRTLAAEGAQVLDLEGLARHRGSLLGGLPGEDQPSQKCFDSMLVADLAVFDPARPVYVEAESKKIGQLWLPDALLAAIRLAPAIHIEASQADRISYLAREYAALFDQAAAFKLQLSKLTGLHGKQTIARWHDWIDQRAIAQLAGELIDRHYDPLYRRSSPDQSLRAARQQRLQIDPGGDIHAAARAVLACN